MSYCCLGSTHKMYQMESYIRHTTSYATTVPLHSKQHGTIQPDISTTTIKSYECCIACVHSHDTYLPVVQACLVLATIVSWTPSPMHQPLCKADHYAMCEQVCGSLLTTFITADYMHSNVTAMVVHSWHIMTEIQVNETCAHTDLIAVLSTARWACISGASFVAERLACCNILTISIKADS